MAGTVPYRTSRLVIPGADTLAPADRRVAEHEAGRAAARAALTSLLGDLPATLAIIRAEDGAPEVTGVDPIPIVSISHGHHTAVAAAGFVARLGIDLADLSDAPRISRVLPRFGHESECALAVDSFAWCTLWALKEAAAKALRSGLLDGGLRVTHVVSLDPPRFSDETLSAIVERHDDHIVAIVWT